MSIRLVELSKHESILDSIFHIMETLEKEQKMPKEISEEFRATQQKLNAWMISKGVDVSNNKPPKYWKPNVKTPK